MTDQKEIVPSMGIWCLSLSWRPYYVLLGAGLRKIRDVIECSAEELLQIQNFGPKSLAEIEDRLATAGLALRAPNTEKVHIPLFPPEPPKPKYINRWFFVPEDYPNLEQSVLFYCVNGNAFLGTYVKGFGWCVPQPKSTGPDGDNLIRINVVVARWMPVPDRDYDQEFA